MIWDLARLLKPPRTYPARGRGAEGLSALFYEGLPYEGKPTRVFAWYGAPERKGGEKLPAVVLVHGGGGTAFAEWVRLWNARGYAAIAMDLGGCVPGKVNPYEASAHRWPGPTNQCFADSGRLVEDQWMCHAVADVILAHSLISRFPEVDADRIGLTGISWGGVVAGIVSGVDKRFKFAAPVYGCGFLKDAHNYFTETWKKMGGKRGDLCTRLWDPASYLGRARMPMLWVTGSNEDHFPLDIFRRSCRMPKGPRTLCVRVRMSHGHEPGWETKEIFAFADSVVKGAEPLARVTGRGRNSSKAWARFVSDVPVVRAELNFTKSRTKWPERKWIIKPAEVDAKRGSAFAVLPKAATAWYFNLVDARGLLISTEHVAID